MARNVRDLFNLSDRVAIVTGGSRGLGKEMAEGLAEAGARLMLCARRREWLDKTGEEFKERGFNVRSMLCDVSKPQDVNAVVKETVKRFGRWIFSSITPVFLGARCLRICRLISGKRS
jgi:NAD(P)-dependent dehydrogenase (short-subunit alcohol dehydrogenase family)